MEIKKELAFVISTVGLNENRWISSGLALPSYQTTGSKCFPL